MRRSARGSVVLAPLIFVAIVILVVGNAGGFGPGPYRGSGPVDEMVDVLFVDEILSETVLRNIGNGVDVDYHGHTITGDLDLGGQGRYVNSTLVLTDCIIDGDVIFSKSVLARGVNFSGTSFRGDVYFTNTSFLDTAAFKGCFFGGGANFAMAQLTGKADFESSAFIGEAIFGEANFSEAVFRNVIFDGQANFPYARFSKSAKFSNVSFNKGAHFEGAKFVKFAYFPYSIFGEDARFTGTDFGDNVRFPEATFCGKAKFRGSKFSGEVLFEDANFEDVADFSRCDFLGEAVFIGARFAEDTDFSSSSFKDSLSFTGATFDEEAAFYNATFNSTVELREAKFRELVMPWSSIKDYLDCDKGVYLALINSYKNSGRILDAADCYYVYRKHVRGRESFGLSKALDTAELVYWGYGVRPYYALFWIGLIIVIFGALFWRTNGISRSDSPNLGKNPLVVKVSRVDGDTYNLYFPPEEGDREVSFKDILYFSYMTLASKKLANLTPDARCARIARIEGYLGRFLIGLLLVLLTKGIYSYFQPPL